jgi:nucleoside phosphorylase
METRAVHAGLLRADSAVRVVNIGFGSKRAAASVESALRDGPLPVCVLLAGVCGSLSSSLRPGRALLYEDVHTHADTAPVLKTDALLTERVAALLPEAKTGIHALQCDRVVTRSHDKRYLAELHGTGAVDMESHVVLGILQNAGVRAAVLRIVSDGLDDDLPDLNAAMGLDGKPDNRLLFREMLRKPRAGMTLAWNGARALTHLKRAIARVACC